MMSLRHLVAPLASPETSARARLPRSSSAASNQLLAMRSKVRPTSRFVSFGVRASSGSPGASPGLVGWHAGRGSAQTAPGRTDSSGKITCSTMMLSMVRRPSAP